MDEEASWLAGDIVSRNGTDEHVIEGFNWARDLMTVRCIKGDNCFDIGDVETNLPYRYELVRRQ